MSFLFRAVGGVAFAWMAGVAAASNFAVGAMQIEHPWTFNTPTGAKVGGAFMILRNTGKEPDRLIKASSPIAGTTELHTHVNENGVMKMRAVPNISIAPGASVALKPGSFHIMFFDLKKPANIGDKFPVTLEFEKAGTTTVQVEVEGRSSGHKHDHSGHKH